VAGVLADRREQLAAGERHPGAQGRQPQLGFNTYKNASGAWVGQHRAANFVDKPMWLMINLQMEGSSGSPGPTSDTIYRARNVYLGRTRA
jgi:hypothetical protein